MKEITISKEFVKKSNELLNKLAKDKTFEKNLLKTFKKDKEYLRESLDLGDNAQSAEDEYEKETKEADEAKTESEKRYNAAVFNYKKHTSLLKLLLKYDTKKQAALGLTGGVEPKSKEDWFFEAMAVYNKIINDPAAVKMLGEYNFTVSDLRQGHQSIVLARDANNTLARESAEAKSAMFNKDYTFSDLYDRMQMIQYFCYYIYLKEPKKFKELGLPIIDNEIGALINIRTKDMVKDSSITKDMVKDSSITKTKNKSATKKEK